MTYHAATAAAGRNQPPTAAAQPKSASHTEFLTVPMLRELAAAAETRFPGVRVTIDVKENYRNMNDVLKDYPQLTEFALEATRRAGLTASTKPIRGGTDGSKLTLRGLPCPNIFTGGQNFHSKLEFNSRRHLEKTVETLVHLVQIFAERSA